MQKPNLLSKIDSVLEYIQTSSSDLTLPKDDEPRKEAAKMQLEIEKEVKEMAVFAENLLEFEYGKTDFENTEFVPKEITDVYYQIKK